MVSPSRSMFQLLAIPIISPLFMFHLQYLYTVVSIMLSSLDVCPAYRIASTSPKRSAWRNSRT